VADAEGRLGVMSYFDQLPDALFADDSGDAPCLACIDNGACKDWVKAMADDTGVDLEWLAEMVINGRIDHQWGTIGVLDLFEKTG